MLDLTSLPLVKYDGRAAAWSDISNATAEVNCTELMFALSGSKRFRD
jgi:hypothetical protein